MSNIIERYKESVDNKTIKPIQKEVNLPNIDPLEKAKDYNKTKEEIDLDSFVEETPTTFLDYQFEDDKNNKVNVNQYSDLIEQAGNKWGISPVLIKAMMSQESEGNLKNLMQITYDRWKDNPNTDYIESINVTNLETGEDKHFVLTDNPDAYDREKYTCITEKDLENPKTNISIATAILASCAKHNNYHIGAAIQEYNLGAGNMNTVFDRTSKQTGKTRAELLSDQINLEFTKNTLIKGSDNKVVGDPSYLSNVLKHIDNYVSNNNYELSIKHKENDTILTSRVQILPNDFYKG